MLDKSDYYKIGEIIKTHGIKGEMMLVSDFPIDYDAINEWLFFNLEECLVPFRIKSLREIGDKNVLFVCDRISDIETAVKYVGTEIYLPVGGKTQKDRWEEPHSLIGYKVVNEDTQELLGRIINFIDNNHNPLLEIETEDDTILLPFIEEFILGLDNDCLYVRLPEGLLDL